MKDILVYKAPICAFLASYFEAWANRTDSKNRWGYDMGKRLQDFTASGKMLRGGVVCMTCDMIRKESCADAVAVGAALEMVQSALLIHDDIMDQSALRRGNPSIHAQYEAHARELGLKRPQRFGESMGVCAGDIAFFIASDILTKLQSTPADLKLKLIQTFSSELIKVGLAQMEDVFHEVWSGEPTREAILEQYGQKTALYTFSLPLLLGGMLAEASAKTLNALVQLGEKLGILFQIVDDGLDILRTSDQIGKSTGLDVISNKKTLHRLALFEACSPGQKDRLSCIFGNSKGTPEQLQDLKKLFVECGAFEIIETLKQELAKETSAIINRLEIGDHGKQLLLRLLDYLVEREK